MIDPSMTDIHPYPPTMQDLERSVVDLTTEINRLNSELEGATGDRDFWRDKYNARMGQIDNLQLYLKDNFDYIDENVVQELVDIFALEINRDYEVEVTVKFSGTVTAPLNFDMDDLENHLNASLEVSYYADVEADFSEDNMEIDWTEA